MPRDAEKLLPAGSARVSNTMNSKDPALYEYFWEGNVRKSQFDSWNAGVG